jgi:hypothetical protein
MELLANLKPGQEILDQLEYVDRMVQQDTRRRIENPPGLYVMYVRDNITPPENFAGSRKKKLVEQARQQKTAAEARDARLRLDYEAFCTAEITRFIENELPAADYQAMFDRHRQQNRQLLRHFSESELDELTHGTVRSQVREQQLANVPAFNEFIQRTVDSGVPA